MIKLKNSIKLVCLLLLMGTVRSWLNMHSGMINILLCSFLSLPPVLIGISQNKHLSGKMFVCFLKKTTPSINNVYFLTLSPRPRKWKPSIWHFVSLFWRILAVYQLV